MQSTPPNDGNRSGRWGQRTGLSKAKEVRGEASMPLNDDSRSGRWGI